MSNDYQPINLADYIHSCIKHRWLILLLTAGLVAITLIYSYSKFPMQDYQMETVLRIGQFNGAELESQEELRMNIFNATQLAEIVGATESYTASKKLTLEDRTSKTPIQFFYFSYHDTDPAVVIKVMNNLQEAALERHQTLLKQKQTSQQQTVAQLRQELEQKKINLKNKEKIIADITSHRTSPLYAPIDSVLFQTYYPELVADQAVLAMLESNLAQQTAALNQGTMTEIVSSSGQPIKLTTNRHLLIFNIVAAILFGLLIGIILTLTLEWWKQNYKN